MNTPKYIKFKNATYRLVQAEDAASQTEGVGIDAIKKVNSLVNKLYMALAVQFNSVLAEDLDNGAEELSVKWEISDQRKGNDFYAKFLEGEVVYSPGQLAELDTMTDLSQKDHVRLFDVVYNAIKGNYYTNWQQDNEYQFTWSINNYDEEGRIFVRLKVIHNYAGTFFEIRVMYKKW